MVIEDLLDTWEERQSTEDNAKKRFHEYEQNEQHLLNLFDAYQAQFWNLKWFADTKDEIWSDRGTSATEAAVIKDDKPVMIVNLENEIITLSAVGIDAGGNWVVGEKVWAQYLLSPENTAIEVKRKIGTDEKISLRKQNCTPIELSAKLLGYVKTYASEYLEEEITQAVISVPAYFDDIQRQAAVKAGIDAGLQVERILNEPTAVALSYGLEHMEEESHILVYDLAAQR